MEKEHCLDCGEELKGHHSPIRCRSCAARKRYIDMHGRPPEMLIAKCAVCEKEFKDYASNRKKGMVRTCSVECRRAWVAVANSIQMGGDGIQRTKNEKDKLYYRGNAAKVRKQARLYYTKNREQILVRLKERDKILKKEVMAAYGGKCECCGESHIEFLTIDHVHGDGAEHRAKCGKGRRMYADIKRQGFPKDKYRCLCFNCNISIGFSGYCPHHTEIKYTLNHIPKVPGRKRTVK